MAETMEIAPALVADLREYARARGIHVGEALTNVLHLGLEAADRAATPAENEGLSAAVHRLERLIHGALGPRVFAMTRILATMAMRETEEKTDMSTDEYVSNVSSLGRMDWDAFVADADPPLGAGR
jgi:hypothetical protein